MRDLTPDETALSSRPSGDARSVVVCAHVDPDGDAVGSVLAATLALRGVGVDAAATLADDRDGPATYAFLPGFELLGPASGLDRPGRVPGARHADLRAARRRGAARALGRARRSSSTTIRTTPASATSTSSTARRRRPDRSCGALLPALGVVPTAAIASDCYAAVMTDTGRFSYSNTTPDTLRDAAAMIEAGADPAETVPPDLRVAQCGLSRAAGPHAVAHHDWPTAIVSRTPGSPRIDLEETGAAPGGDREPRRRGAPDRPASTRSPSSSSTPTA